MARTYQKSKMGNKTAQMNVQELKQYGTLFRLAERTLVKQLPILGWRFWLSAPLVLMVLLCGSGCGTANAAETQLTTSSTASSSVLELSSEGQALARRYHQPWQFSRLALA